MQFSLSVRCWSFEVCLSGCLRLFSFGQKTSNRKPSSFVNSLWDQTQRFKPIFGVVQHARPGGWIITDLPVYETPAPSTWCFTAVAVSDWCCNPGPAEKGQQKPSVSWILGFPVMYHCCSFIHRDGPAPTGESPGTPSLLSGMPSSRAVFSATEQHWANMNYGWSWHAVAGTHEKLPGNVSLWCLGTFLGSSQGC